MTQRVWIGLGLVVTTAAIFARVAGHEFVRIDTEDYVTANDMVRRGLTWEGFVWAFRTNHASNWHPLTWLSHMLDCQLFGLDPRAHHLTNAAIHVSNVALLYGLLCFATGAVWRSALVAALFAVHPLRVESVAWVAERKDVLCTFFWLCSMLAHVGYARLPTWRRYGLVAAAVALALMSKPMAVTLPFALLLLDYWPLGRLRLDGTASEIRSSARSLSVEKLPLFAMVAGSIALTIWAQQSGGAIKSIVEVPFSARVLNALLALATYVRQTVWPMDLAVFYPFGRTVSMVQVALSAAVVGAASALAIWRLKRERWLAVGWFWYVGTLVPVLGLVQVGSQAHADRYTYIPSIGLFIVVGFGLGELVRRRAVLRPLVIATSAVVIAVSSVVTWNQLAHWRTSVTLFEHALAVTGENWLAEGNLALALADRGRHDLAIPHHRTALRLLPESARAAGHENLAVSLLATGAVDLAIEEFEAAVELAPDQADTRSNFGVALAHRGRWTDALVQHREASRLAPEDPQVRANLARSLEATGAVEAAEVEYRAAVRLAPERASTHEDLGDALQRADRLDEAMASYEAALRLEPRRIPARLHLALALEQKGRVAEAAAQYRFVLDFEPGNSEARLGVVRLLILHDDPELADMRSAALGEIWSDSAFFELLAQGYAQMERLPEAIEAARVGLGRAQAIRDRTGAARIEGRIRDLEARRQATVD